MPVLLCALRSLEASAARYGAGAVHSSKVPAVCLHASSYTHALSRARAIHASARVLALLLCDSYIRVLQSVNTEYAIWGVHYRVGFHGLEPVLTPSGTCASAPCVICDVKADLC